MSTITLEQWVKRIEDIEKGLPGYLQKELTRVGLIAEGKAKLNATTRLRVRTGHLRQSIQHKVKPDGKSVRLVLRAGNRTTVPYARIQEVGGEVRAKSGGFLRIPLKAAKTGAGVDRFPGPLRQSGVDFHVRESGGRLFLFRSDQEGGPPWYRLVKRVRIRPKLFLFDALKDARKLLDPAIRKQLHASVEFGEDV